ncbi:MAG: hypothetical protein AABX34_05310 [Nanoarchaeota archaeon]
MANEYVIGSTSDHITIISNVPAKGKFKGGRKITLQPGLTLIYNGEGDQKLFYREDLGFFSRVSSSFEFCLVFGKPYEHTFYLMRGGCVWY